MAIAVQRVSDEPGSMDQDQVTCPEAGDFSGCCPFHSAKRWIASMRNPIC
jgi:hypothetical protein